jgi:hypothetical protein
MGFEEIMTDAKTVNFIRIRALFRSFNSSEASHEDDEPTIQLELIDLHYSNELWSEFK